MEKKNIQGGSWEYKVEYYNQRIDFPSGEIRI